MRPQNSTKHSTTDVPAFLNLPGFPRPDPSCELRRDLEEESASSGSGGMGGSQSDQGKRSQESPTAQGGLSGKTILVVDDIDGVRDLIRELLEMDGFDVLQAHDGKAALQVARQHRGPIHLLLTDVVMPQMGGKDLADQLLQLRPDVRVVFMSGYSDEAIAHHGILQPGTAFLKKPFTSDSLTRCVREILVKA